MSTYYAPAEGPATLKRHLPALNKPENSIRFYQAVDAISDSLEEQYPKFLDRLLFDTPGEAFIPTLRYYAITGTAKIINPEG